MTVDDVTPSQAIAAVKAGALAVNQPHTTCPYSAAGDANERVLAAAWLRGWLRARHRIR